ncbi:MAG TPA: hypothetical protein VFC33_17390 [Acidimicrobiia bacterium]|nr:hypothetical protein [Acidimicrobiia bacterium]
MSFYDEVLRELLAAVGAAMFFGNLYALARRRADAREHAARSASRGRKASARGPAPRARSASGSRQQTSDLAQAPVARTLVYIVLGFVMMVAGIAALVAR